MLIVGLVAGLLAGLVAGGRIDNLAEVRLRWVWLIFLALILRFGTEAALRADIPIAETLRVPLFTVSFGVLIYGLWINRGSPGLLVTAAGATSNAFAMLLNGGFMPVWGPSLQLSGLSSSDLRDEFHVLLPEGMDLEFLARAGPFGDVLPITIPYLENVSSVGDVFIAAGLGWFVFSTLLGRSPLTRPRLAGLSRTAVADAPALDRPMMLGGSPSAALPVVADSGILPGVSGLPEGEARPGLRPRIRGHPYVRLALDARFSAFWIGQTISLFGDRLHQVALGVLVLDATDSPLLTGMVFLAATLPNLLLSPIAGTFVDRWDHKHVMVASDLLRAGMVLLLPVAATANLALVYPLVFAITTVSIFFRPAKAAVVPRIVDREDLTAANSATWTGETLADIAGYPLAGLFVAFLGSALAIAFWVDAATYLVSGILLAGLAIPAVVKAATPAAEAAVGAGRQMLGPARRFFGELRDGWRFLRSHPSLFQNTLISAIAQTSVGATLALTVVYARQTLDGTLIPYPQSYAAIETAIGLRIRKGPMIVGGFIVMGLATLFLGLTSNVALAMVAALAVGIANLVYIIPTQTLFAELTPMPLMGRVVAFRSSLVFGAMTGAMALSGILAEGMAPGSAGIVIAGFGAVTAVSGLVAAALPAVRDS